MHEQGPEAAATLARLTNREIVFRGEGGHIEIGTDGPTFCVVTDSGTLVDLLDEDEVAEADWRRGLSIRRFASAVERDSYLDAQPWQEHVRSHPERAIRKPVKPVQPRATHFELSLDAGSRHGEVRVRAEAAGERPVAVGAIRTGGRLPLGSDVELSRSEWARFNEELFLLGIRNWRDYGGFAPGGLRWSLSYAETFKTSAAGSDAYPPDGDVEVSSEFTRLLLACERMLGRELWSGLPVADALRHIPDERDRVEHAILSAVRTWAADAQLRGLDPCALTENDVEKGLTPFLEALMPVRRQRRVKNLLEGWPGVGALDIEIAADGFAGPAWVELKWARTASTLHNCLWDAAKVASAQRERRAAYGYLLAGAPDAAWQDSRAPVELFGVSAHHGSSVVDDHFSWWKAWFDENARTYPLRLPSPLVTVPVGRVFMRGADGDLRREPWTIRLARVHAPGGSTYVPRPR